MAKKKRGMYMKGQFKMRAAALKHKHLKSIKKRSTLPSGTLVWNQSKRPSIGHSLFSLRNNKFWPP